MNVITWYGMELLQQNEYFIGIVVNDGLVF